MATTKKPITDEEAFDMDDDEAFFDDDDEKKDTKPKVDKDEYW